MHALVAHVNVHPDNHEQFLTQLQTSVLQEAREQPGYKAALVLSDPKTGQVLTIGLFEDRQPVLDSGFVDTQVSNVSHHVKDPIQVETTWEVIIADGSF